MTLEELKDAGLRYDVDGAVCTITLDRPDSRNSQTPTMWRALAQLGASLPDDVRVVIVRGAGPTFSAGLDRRLLDPSSIESDQESVAELLLKSDDEISRTIDEYQQGFTWLRDPRFVSIAAVHGYAIGAGFQLALSCDLIVATESSQFCMKEAALGLVPDLTGTKPLVDRVGYSKALEICATARMVTGEEAGRIGIADSVVSEADLDSTVTDLVGALTAHLHGAVREIKALLVDAGRRDLDEQRLVERTKQIARFRELATMLAG